MSGSERDMLAAEYVLGTLDEAERAQARRLIETDPAFAETVRAWERRLTPLSRLPDPLAPPDDLWHRIEARTAAPVSLDVVHARRVLRGWQAATAGALALAAAFAGLAFLRSPPPRMMALATHSSGPLMLAVDGHGGALIV
ncbi:MAG: hypothetical protein ACREFY_13720, partial [Acetobacteraceae bacterium]